MIEIFGIPYLKKGSGIHIKKKNRGKFTKYCNGKVTQKCIDKAKRSGNPTLVKRATFAENSRKWKHAYGGTLIPCHFMGNIIDRIRYINAPTYEANSLKEAIWQAYQDDNEGKIIKWNGNFYKANLHCHSVYSDGKLTVEELKERYKEKGYSRKIAYRCRLFIYFHTRRKNQWIDWTC